VTIKYEIKFPRCYGCYTEVEDPGVTKKLTGVKAEAKIVCPAVFGKQGVSESKFKLSGISAGKEKKPLEERPEELALWLPLYEGEGTKVGDLSLYGNHGTVYGAVWKQLPTGKWVLVFDGVDDIVRFADFTFSEGEAYTYLIWFKLLRGGFDQQIVGESAGFRSGFIISAANTIYVYFGGTGASVAPFADYIGKWVMVAHTVRFEAANKRGGKVFINDTKVASPTGLTGTLWQFDGAIGRRPGGPWPAQMEGGEFKFYKRELSDDEIKSYFNEYRDFYGA